MVLGRRMDIAVPVDMQCNDLVMAAGAAGPRAHLVAAEAERTLILKPSSCPTLWLSIAEALDQMSMEAM
jgi:hypothetical protein